MRRARTVHLACLTVLALTAAACSSDAGSSDTTVTPPSTTAPDATVPDTTKTPPTTIEESSSRYQATIRRDGDGVPHIVADDLASVFFGQGYASGQDYSCTLADQLLKVQSRRAAAYGRGDDDVHLNSDLGWAAIGIDALARQDYRNVSDLVREQFEAFAAGWNAHLADVGSDGLGGWCAGADWVEPITGEDLYAYARSIALSASGAQLASYVATAQPPDTSTVADDEPTDEAAFGAEPPAPETLLPEPIASNGWAVGPDLTESGKGSLLVANPHFPWEGELRFWESHLTVPGEFDIYGVQLTGLPGIGIGFTESFGWTHTVSAGNRFTAYTLTLAPGDPTTYLVDGEPRAMTSQDITIAVLEDDGSVSQVTRTLWSSEYGPIIDFPGLGWSDTLVISYRDANLGNDEFIEQYAAMNAATSLEEFIEAHRTYQGVPLFNTIAAGADGRVWYADTSATPNLTAEAEQLFRERLATDPITQLARSNGVILLDGSDSRFAWEEQDGARDPGLVPWEEMPMVERTDYVFNANDSFWLNNDGDLLVGDYSLLHGEQGTQLSERTRQNVHMLENRSATQPAGADGRFSGEELRDATLANEAYTAVQFLDGVVERCDGAGEVNGVDLSEACSVLAGWDGIYDLDRAGPILWREWLSALPGGIADLWATPFDPDDPANTPSGLAPAPAGEPDPVLVALAEAVNVLRSQGHGPDVVLGDLQYTERGSERIPIHGGTQREGLTNMVYWGGLGSSTEPTPKRGDGYPISYGTSFLLTVDFSGDEVQAWAFLVYSNTEDRSSPLFDAQMRRFSEKDWRTLRLTDAAIEADPDLTVLEVIGD